VLLGDAAWSPTPLTGLGTSLLFTLLILASSALLLIFTACD